MRFLLIFAISAIFMTAGCDKSSSDEASEQTSEESTNTKTDKDQPSSETQKPEKTAPKTLAEKPVSQDILNREPTTEQATVKHILISWKDKASIFEKSGGIDPRAAERTEGQANALAAEILQRATTDKNAEDFDALMSEYSEDKGSARTAKEYNVTPDAGLVQNFKTLSLRLNKGEIGIVESVFGYHIIKRVQ